MAADVVGRRPQLPPWPSANRRGHGHPGQVHDLADRGTVIKEGSGQVAADPDSAAFPMRTLLRGLPVFAGDLPEFGAETVPDDPATLFARWLATAIEQHVPEPHAMTVSTADDSGQPSSRVLTCKDVAQAGRWSFASGASSRKGRDLAVNPRAALLFYWPQQGRQVRVRGTVAPAPAAASIADFLARPPDSRAESLSGHQSDVLGDPAEVVAALAQSKEALAARPDVVAPGWTLYVLTAEDVEFWQARRDRQHARLLLPARRIILDAAAALAVARTVGRVPARASAGKAVATPRAGRTVASNKTYCR